MNKKAYSLLTFSSKGGAVMEFFIAVYLCAMFIVAFPIIAQCIEFGVARTIQVQANHISISCYGDEEMKIFTMYPKTMFCVSTFVRATLPIVNVVLALRIISK